jgi:hypothetical protein
MLRAIVVVVLAVTGLAACSGAPVGSVDGGGPPDGGTTLPSDGRDIDGPPTGGGLIFDFAAAPPLAQPFGAVTVDEMRVWLRDVRAIGDSAPGDSRTSLAYADLDYRPDRDPTAIQFPLAPPGRYSSLDARLGQVSGGGNNGYELRGHVVVGGKTYELHVSDQDATDPISVALGGLPVEGTTVVGVRLDLSFLGRLDWSQAVHGGNDKIELDSSSPFTAQVRAGVIAAWTLAP